MGTLPYSRRLEILNLTTPWQSSEYGIRGDLLSYVADPPRGFASYLEKVMKRQWGSRRDTRDLIEAFKVTGGLTDYMDQGCLELVDHC